VQFPLKFLVEFGRQAQAARALEGLEESADLPRVKPFLDREGTFFASE